MQEVGRRLGYQVIKRLQPHEIEFEGLRPFNGLDPSFVMEMAYLRI